MQIQSLAWGHPQTLLLMSVSTQHLYWAMLTLFKLKFDFRGLLLKMVVVIKCLNIDDENKKLLMKLSLIIDSLLLFYGNIKLMVVAGWK